MSIFRKLFRTIRKKSYYVLCHYNDKRRQKIIPSKTPIDVAIMVLEKDLDILPLCIEGVKKHVKQVVDNIYVVCPSSELIKKFCCENNLNYIVESSILGYSPKDLEIVVTSDGEVMDRSGWLFQQLVKLSGKIGECQYTLFIDSDHILLNDHVFLTSKGKTVYYMSNEFHLPYYINMRRLLKKKVLIPPVLSFVSHKMLFDKEKLMALHDILEEKNNNDEKWDEAIINQYDKKEKSGFSEFELYGYLFGSDGIWLPWNELRLNYAKKMPYEFLQKEYKHLSSVTFPSFLK